MKPKKCAKTAKLPKTAKRKKGKNWNVTHAHPTWCILTQNIWKAHKKHQNMHQNVGLSENGTKNAKKRNNFLGPQWLISAPTLLKITHHFWRLPFNTCFAYFCFNSFAFRPHVGDSEGYQGLYLSIYSSGWLSSYLAVVASQVQDLAIWARWESPQH